MGRPGIDWRITCLSVVAWHCRWGGREKMVVTRSSRSKTKWPLFRWGLWKKIPIFFGLHIGTEYIFVDIVCHPRGLGFAKGLTNVTFSSDPPPHATESRRPMPQPPNAAAICPLLPPYPHIAHAAASPPLPAHIAAQVAPPPAF